MDEDGLDEKPLGRSLSSRHRSPAFSKEEVKILINLVDKYKNILLNKSINYTACHAKEVTWATVKKIFNAQGFKHQRSVDCLKVKWDNLKKEARKVSKNLIDINQQQFDEQTCQIVAMINVAENISDISLPKDVDDIKVTDDEEPKQTNKNESKYWNDETNVHNTSRDDGVKNIRFRGKRSINFSPQECSLLLKCVRPEKKFVFCKETTLKAAKLKNRAWTRIAHAFNQLSPQKRSAKILQTKFSNMKSLARRHKRNIFENNSDQDYMSLENADVTNEKIKTEPASRTDNESDDDHNVEGAEHVTFNDLQTNADHSRDLSLDPLSTVLNSDSGIGSINMDPFNFSENKEIVKLKTELLQFQLENAKLERKRIEDAIRTDAELKQARATETALRLRAARLDAISSAMKFTSGHPALHFTSEEKCAQTYISQYQT